MHRSTVLCLGDDPFHTVRISWGDLHLLEIEQPFALIRNL